jgi:hypothetical protein
MLAPTVRENISIYIPDAELSLIFGQSGCWAQGMMAQYLHWVQSDNYILRGHLDWPNRNRKSQVFGFAEGAKPQREW